MVLASGLAFSMFVYQQVVVEGAVGPAAMFGIGVLGLVFLACLTLLLLSLTRHRETVKGVLLAGSAAAFAYIVFDVAAGFVLIRPLSPPLVPDGYRHHQLVPNSHAEFRQRDFAYIQRVNNLGLRGEDATVEKPAGTKRVLMLGDSFTMGKGVEDDQTFSVLVERSLQQAMASCGGGAVEVLNGGVDSYAPILSLLQFKRDLAPLDPDLVILNLDLSDLIQEAAYRGQAVRGPNGEVVAVPQLAQESLYERFLSWTTRHLFFTRVVLVYVNRAFDHGTITVRRVVNEAGREHFAHTLEGDVDRTEQWRDIFESIGRIRAHADSLGMEFLLTTYPWAHQLGDSGWVPGRFAYMQPGERTTDLSAQTIRELSAAGGIQLLETFPVFRAYEGSEVLYFAYDPHWTPAGHEVMARALEQRLLEDYVPRWCGTR
jgi:hypothetical protein